MDSPQNLEGGKSRAKLETRVFSQFVSMNLCQNQCVRHLWLVVVLVELCQFIHGEMPLDLLLVHHTCRQTLLGHLPVIDLFLHCALGQETVNVDRLLLAEPENSRIPNIQETKLGCKYV